MKINVAGIVEESIVDGEGFRFVVFCQGCPHHCVGCHNPSSWSFEEKEMVDADDIYQKMIKNPMLDGLTLSGGEPFMQVDALVELAKKVKPKYNIWCYTGFTFEELLRDEHKMKLLNLIDVLVDGRFELSQRDLTLTFKGSRNQRIIDVQKSLENNNIMLYDLNA